MGNELRDQLLTMAGQHQRDAASLWAHSQMLEAKGDMHCHRVRERSEFHTYTVELLHEAADALLPKIAPPQNGLEV